MFFLFITGVLSAQQFLPREGFFPGTLHYKNGQVKEALVAAPKTCNQKVIFIKADLKAKSEKVQSCLLDSISIKTNNGNTYDFDHLDWTYKKEGKPRKARWFFATIKGYTTLYLLSSAFVITREGNAYAVINGTIYYYLIRKKNEKVAYYFGVTATSHAPVNSNYILKKSASLYLSEDKDLVDKINKKVLTHKNIPEIINIYNDFMSKYN